MHTIYHTFVINPKEQLFCRMSLTPSGFHLIIEASKHLQSMYRIPLLKGFNQKSGTTSFTSGEKAAPQGLYKEQDISPNLTKRQDENFSGRPTATLKEVSLTI